MIAYLRTERRSKLPMLDVSSVTNMKCCQRTCHISCDRDESFWQLEEQISGTSPHVEPLSYSLFFFHGVKDGWGKESRNTISLSIGYIHVRGCLRLFECLNSNKYIAKGKERRERPVDPKGVFIQFDLLCVEYRAGQTCASEWF